MSGNDDTKDGGKVFHFPRIVLPDSLDAPRPGTDQGMTGGPAEGYEPSVPAGVWPSLPSVSEMGPPLALTMPGIPDPGPGADDAEDGAFTPPAPEDPANPTVRDTLAVAVALMTALGVAAAQGMWHRARQRSALADQARATADKATSKALAGRGASKGAAGSESSLLRSLGSSGKTNRRSGGGKHIPPRDAHSGSPHGPGRGPGHDRKRPSDKKAPKADRDGKKTWTDPSKQKRRKLDKGGPGSDGACVQTLKPKKADAKTPKVDAGKKAPKSPKARKKAPGKLTWKAPKSKGVKPTGWTSGRPKGTGKGTPKPKRPKLTWKAPKRRPWPGGGKNTAGRKRWTRGKVKPIPKLRKKSWTRRVRKTGVKWFKRWAAGTTTPPPWPRTPSWRTSRRRSRGSAWRWFARGRRGASSTSDWVHLDDDVPPPPRFGWMRPPPGADRSTWVESSERVDEPIRRKYEPDPHTPIPALAGAPAGGRLALPAGSTTPTAAPAAARTNGARPVNSHVPTTQYRDADLTIYDVIDADADMAEEITAGVDEARATADGCEQLMTKLEAVHAKIVELKVPGLLAGWMLRLMDKTATVRARALAIATNLPAAAEAIAVAGSNAAARHQPLADVTRDMGHVRPAEREYHME